MTSLEDIFRLIQFLNHSKKLTVNSYDQIQLKQLFYIYFMDFKSTLLKSHSIKDAYLKYNKCKLFALVLFLVQ
ncbi:hypothetical protein CW311_19390 [Acinetobacter proteolyticus]|uniref:Uncharacterized protein n=1 Tax=Acinetobacter proteolyticus TaxID=1776741 RepID=A0A2N0WAA5_9GAMM|nr:hypothetical protein CW311_19390 [Acinetobacter proteolyticus]